MSLNKALLGSVFIFFSSVAGKATTKETKVLSKTADQLGSQLLTSLRGWQACKELPSITKFIPPVEKAVAKLPSDKADDLKEHLKKIKEAHLDTAIILASATSILTEENASGEVKKSAHALLDAAEKTRKCEFSKDERKKYLDVLSCRVKRHESEEPLLKADLKGVRQKLALAPAGASKDRAALAREISLTLDDIAKEAEFDQAVLARVISQYANAKDTKNIELKQTRLLSMLTELFDRFESAAENSKCQPPEAPVK